MDTPLASGFQQRLRAQAEAQLRRRPPADARAPDARAPDAPGRLLLELETHQLELEMQNEELLAAYTSLERANQEFASLFEQAPVSYVSLTAQGFIERANQRVCGLLRAARADELTGRRFLAFVAPAHRLAADAWLEQLQHGPAPAPLEIQMLPVGPGAGPSPVVQLDGVADAAAPGARTCRVALFDVSEQHRAAAALLRSQERTRLALAASHAGVMEWDPATDHLYLDEQARAFFDWPGPAGLLPLREVHARVLPTDLPALAGALNRATTGQPLAVEFQVRTADGAPRFLAAHGEMVFEASTRMRLIGQLRDVTSRRRVQQAAAALELRQQRAVFEAVLATQEEERRRMADALHNGVGQLLYLTKLRLTQLAAPDPALESALRLIDEAIRDVRTLSAELAPAILEDFGLRAALEAMAKRVPRQQLRTHCNFRGLDEPLPGPLQTLVYRMVQELLNNVIKHAQAEEVFLHVVREGDHLYVNVDDDGRGFTCPAARAGGEAPGIGLASIRSQVARAGGVLHINSQPGHGTAISIELPVVAPEKAA